MKSDELVVGLLGKVFIILLNTNLYSITSESPREVSIVGPEFLLLNSVTEFERITQEGIILG